VSKHQHRAQPDEYNEPVLGRSPERAQAKTGDKKNILAGSKF
jgi:hypothetical protein